MNIKEIRNITLEDIYWQLKYGKSKKRISVFELRSELNKYVKSPVFFLSTGRCGTKWFSDLLSYNKSLMVLHSPVPSLAIQSKLAYNVFNNERVSESELNLLKEIYFAGREQFLRYSYKTGKRYIETNNYITFFAPILIELFPDAKFVHLFRHPGEFVRSGIRRNYYTSANYDDIKRISPTSKDRNNNWDSFSQLEKVSWLWNETNLFIENFKSKYSENCFDFNFNNLSKESVISLLEFLNIDINGKIISKSLIRKSNIQKQGAFPKYENWDENNKTDFLKICGKLAQKYNYNL